MNNLIKKRSLLLQMTTALRIVIATLFVCSVLYPLLILGIGQTLTPYSANGSLLLDKEGHVVGSESLAQKFTDPKYFFPRPSAVDYEASATGGSNLSPNNPALRARAKEVLEQIPPVGNTVLPLDLVTASGSGMDPHIRFSSAEYQIERVASARGMSVLQVKQIVDSFAKRPGALFTPDPLINVLLVNRALDQWRPSGK